MSGVTRGSLAEISSRAVQGTAGTADRCSCSPCSTSAASPATSAPAAAPVDSGDDPVAAVREILADVSSVATPRVRELTERFDGVDLDDLRVPVAELARRARRRRRRRCATRSRRPREGIADFHAQPAARPSPATSATASSSRAVTVPVDRAGCYVPGRTGGLPVDRADDRDPGPGRRRRARSCCACRPTATGTVPDVDARRGRHRRGRRGLRASAAPRRSPPWPTAPSRSRPVDVIVGPGQRLRGARQARGRPALVGVPSAFAGPSEVVVVADDTTPAELAAIDVIVQAEHGPDGLAWLITWDEAAADADRRRDRPRSSPRRPARDDIEATLAEGGYAVLVDGPEQAIAVANAIAPEHLELLSPTPRRWCRWCATPARCSAARGRRRRSATTSPGRATCCPPYGSARFGQALTVDDFHKHVHVVTLDRGRARQGRARTSPRSPRPRASPPTPTRSASASPGGDRR